MPADLFLIIVNVEEELNINVNCTVSAKSMFPASAEEVVYGGELGIVWASSFPCCSACTGYVPVTEISFLCF